MNHQDKNRKGFINTSGSLFPHPKWERGEHREKPNPGRDTTHKKREQFGKIEKVPANSNSYSERSVSYKVQIK